ncbi:MAG TPA: choice-of-anchor B family protein [Chitinophagales bacterium]|nr:choice-of-anchor B family protein [Chitinophagales bacterium]
MKKVLISFFILLSFSAFAQKNVRLRSVLTYQNLLSNVWGYADSAGREYALVGLFDGMSIVDVTNPDSISELFHIPGPHSIWREIKTWNHHAYATNESGDGLLIASLEFLPDSVIYFYWTADTSFKTAHTLFIDEKGILYLFGYNDLNKNIPYDQRGVLICDLNPNPESPVIIGKYNVNYVHDGYVRGDTLWASQISAGNFAVIDVSDKANPAVLAIQETPNRFTHNCWLSDDGNYLFTTDERPGAFITSYDVSDLGNITELDRYQAAPGSLLIPHNTYFLNNYLITSYYKYGMNIVDAAYPDNLVEVGYYDTSPFPNGDGFIGCWGVYPFFPSGTIVASDIQTGLYVLTPDFKRACYLVGNVRDDSTGAPLNDVSVEIMTTGVFKKSNLSGDYRTGASDAGTYDVRFISSNCLTKIVTGVQLQTALVETLNVALTCTSFVSIPEADGNKMMLKALPSVFENETVVRYRLPFNEQAVLKVFDYNGRLVEALRIADAEGEIVLGKSLESGIYLVGLFSDSITTTLRVMRK